MSNYRDHLETYCNRAGYSRSSVGIEAGYNKNYVSDVIKGKITPTIEALDKLASALKVPLANLLFGDSADPQIAELVSKIRKIDSSGQKAVHALVETLSAGSGLD